MAYRLFSLTAKLWQRLQRSVWDDASDLFSKLSVSLGSHANFIKEHSPVQDYDALQAAFQQYSYGLKSEWKNFETDKKDRRRKRKYEVAEWIASSRKMQRLQNEFREMAICPKSGRWLFRNYSDISEWMGEEDPPHSAIWLHGNMGYGKTVLASLIVDELKSSKLQNTMPSFPEASKTCYFYCQENDIEQKSHLDVLKGILLQMVEAEDYIIPYCYQEKITSGGSVLMDAKLAQKLIKTFIEFSVRHYIVIDGVDECHGAEIQQTAKFFKDLVSAYDTQIRLGHLRVLFIGRETSDTKKHIPGDDCFADFTSALKNFINTHRADLTTTKHAELVEEQVEKFIDLEIYDDLHLLWNHIYTHQRGDYATRNTVGIKKIEDGLKDNRTQLEILLVNQKVGDEDTAEDYYGSKPYKCNRTLCRFFHVGYNNARDRDNHGKRHERPFQCPVSCNAAPLGGGGAGALRSKEWYTLAGTDLNWK
ncbi:hypothetical protein FVER53590_03173 [Fusarium verticillioides]|nr:hypothetical protein FVER53590_03173 [Fusarium verticillioides]